MSLPQHPITDPRALLSSLTFFPDLSPAQNIKSGKSVPIDLKGLKGL